MDKCKTCKKKTNTFYFDECSQCYALRTFAKNPPSTQEIKTCWPNCNKCGDHFPNASYQAEAPCKRCEFILKYIKKANGLQTVINFQ